MPDKQPNGKSSTPAPKRDALGKGLGALLGLDKEEAPRPTIDASSMAVLDMDITRVHPNPRQPRKIFREADLLSLAQSLKQDGVIQPLVVSKDDDGYMIIAGERRWRASQLAGFDKVPVIVKEVTPEDMLRLAIIENVQRANLNVIEEAEAYAMLIKDYGLTQDDCARKVGKDRATITNLLRILSLPQEVQDDLMNEKLTMGHGRAILALEEKSLILQARDIVLAKKLSVRQTEQLVKRMKRQGAEAQESDIKSGNADLDYLADTLRSHLRTKVRLQGTGSRGKIEISFFSPAELERLLQLISGGAF
ncbi:MAG: ParB/RepB/Spo0J family partition protein [Proteobacteria bacterium]|nr:MAG: ParB/RepB/Spo0J family partition protein [Pseudomonadota bacterium]